MWRRGSLRPGDQLPPTELVDFSRKDGDFLELKQENLGVFTRQEQKGTQDGELTQQKWISSSNITYGKTTGELLLDTLSRFSKHCFGNVYPQEWVLSTENAIRSTNRDGIDG